MLSFLCVLGAVATDPADLTVEVTGLCVDGDMTTRDYCFTGACLSGKAPDDIPAKDPLVALRFNTVILNGGEVATTTVDPNSDSFFDSTCYECGNEPFKMVKQFKSHSIVAVDSDVIAPGTDVLILPHCLQDTDCDEGEANFTSCGEPGLSPGCTDRRSYEDFCQWIDVTDLDKDSIYRLRVEINYNPGVSGIVEDPSNNIAYVQFSLADLPKCKGIPRCTSLAGAIIVGALLCCSCICCYIFCCRFAFNRGKKSAEPVIQQSTPPVQKSTPPASDTQPLVAVQKMRRRALNFDM